MQNYFGPFILANKNHTIRNTVVISSYFGLQLIFVPFKFAVLFGSRNKGHANIKDFTVAQKYKTFWHKEVVISYFQLLLST